MNKPVDDHETQRAYCADKFEESMRVGTVCWATWAKLITLRARAYTLLCFFNGCDVEYLRGYPGDAKPLIGFTLIFPCDGDIHFIGDLNGVSPIFDGIHIAQTLAVAKTRTLRCAIDVDTGGTHLQLEGDLPCWPFRLLERVNGKCIASTGVLLASLDALDAEGGAV